MYRWELDGPAQQEFAGLPPAARASLAAFMDAVVIVDPVQYQRRRDEREDVSMPLRSLHFGPDGGAWSRSWCTHPMILCLSSRSSGSAVSIVWLSSGGLMPPGGHALIGRAAVTFCSWYLVIAMAGVDRFVDRATRASGAISAIGGTTPWYPCS